MFDSEYKTVKGGTIIRLSDRRIGTIVWNNLDGMGGIFGRHNFSDVPQNFDDGWPPPEFMLREKEVEYLMQDNNPNGKVECVGRRFNIIQEAD